MAPLLVSVKLVPLVSQKPLQPDRSRGAHSASFVHIFDCIFRLLRGSTTDQCFSDKYRASA